MAQIRAYVSSRTLLKALSRPFLPQCPLSRMPLVGITRGKRTSAADASASKTKAKFRQGSLSKDQRKVFEELESRMKVAAEKGDAFRPMTDEELNATDLPVVNFYEEDLDKGTPRRLIKTIATPEDRRREQEMSTMIEESYNNPDYDDTELNRRLMDNLIADPDFADLADELREMKGNLKGKEEIDALAKEEYASNLRAAANDALQDLIDDPDLEEARHELLEAQNKLPPPEDFENPDFQAALEKAMAVLKDNDAFQKKMAALSEEPATIEREKRMAQLEEDLNGTTTILEDEDEDGDDDLDMETSEDLQSTLGSLLKMREILESLGDQSGIIDEIDAILVEELGAIDGEDVGQELNPKLLVGKVKQLIQSHGNKHLRTDAEADTTDIPDELRDRIEEIVVDPELPQKLSAIQRLISDSQKADITMIPHQTAPDPSDLEASQITTLEQQVLVVRSSPEHIDALERLNVRLSSPHNISPMIKSFNEAIELAYVGANDDIRRVLWRAYQKARTIPTFLENVSDEAWDILYYSQAVKWSSNQNRESHLKIILADLKSLGRDGPPTHPQSLVK